MLATAPCARSPHFAVHFLDASPSAPGNARLRLSRGRLTAELSTASSTAAAPPVDEGAVAALEPLPEGSVARARAWLGMVVPKRHARRAVTRSLVKRQVRAAAGRVVAPACPGAGPASAGAAEAPRGLPGGLWIVRMRAPYPRDEYPSAASDALRAALRVELDRLFAAALRQCPGGAAPRRPRSGAGMC